MKKWGKSAFVYLVLFLVVLGFIWVLNIDTTSSTKLPYSDFMTKLTDGEIKSIYYEGNTITGEFKTGDQTFETYVPPMLMRVTGEAIDRFRVEQKAFVDGEPPATTPFYVEILPVIMISLLLFGVLWFVMLGSAGAGNSKAMNFGRSRAKAVKNVGKKITFEDVAGLAEEKEELMELVDFLKNPKRFSALGARIPKGVLMVGPPGTGKTYLSRAVAGEADVPFFSISGSEFVEMFVGVGASRVRDLFEEGKKNAPCIIFIDEIDAIGRKRGSGLGGGHDEREQTLNQILVEMDGFVENTGVIIMAATNRADVLDPALLRPGRFDRNIHVGLPDIREREAILKVHARNKPIGPDVDFAEVAKSTPGFSPADIENVMNEAALLTAKENDTVIRMATIKKSIIKMVAGVEKKTRVVLEKERRLTAYHEAGHAVLAYLLPDQDPVHQVTIIPRGRAGGFTLQFPEHDKSYRSKKALEGEITVLLGGRVSEKIMLDDISTGASNDLEKVTAIARNMVTVYAMSEHLGAMCYDDGQDVFIGRDFGAKKSFSDSVQAEIDAEIRCIVDKAYNVAYDLLENNQDKIINVAESLLKYETINGEEFLVAIEQGVDALVEFVEDNKKKLEEDKKLRKEEQEKQEAELLKTMEALAKEQSKDAKSTEDDGRIVICLDSNEDEAGLKGKPDSDNGFYGNSTKNESAKTSESAGGETISVASSDKEAESGGQPDSDKKG